MTWFQTAQQLLREGNRFEALRFLSFALDHGTPEERRTAEQILKDEYSVSELLNYQGELRLAEKRRRQAEFERQKQEWDFARELLRRKLPSRQEALRRQTSRERSRENCFESLSTRKRRALRAEEIRCALAPETRESPATAEIECVPFGVEGVLVGKYPVTQEQYESVMGENRFEFFPGNPKNPATGVSYIDAMRFCRRLTVLKRKRGEISEGLRYALPTPEQWVQACFGTLAPKTRYYSGESDSDLERIAWIKSNSGGCTHPVGLKEPNRFGMHDLFGNVYEWLITDGFLDGNGLFDRRPLRSVVGGFFGDMGKYVYGACAHQADRFDCVGFRVALVPESDSSRSENRKKINAVMSYFEQALRFFEEKENEKAVKFFGYAQDYGDEEEKALAGKILAQIKSGEGDVAPFVRECILSRMARWLIRANRCALVPGTSESPATEEIECVPFGVEGLLIGKYPVTQEQYESVMGENRFEFFSGNPKNPATGVSHIDAVEFCRRLTSRKRERNEIPEGFRYTLPTSEQWTLACFGTRKPKTKYYSGDTKSDLERIAWVKSNSRGSTHPVGLKKPNRFGICDLFGNVFEWLNGIKIFDKKGCRHFLVVGGCFSGFGGQCADESERLEGVGFRVVLAPEKQLETSD